MRSPCFQGPRPETVINLLGMDQSINRCIHPHASPTCIVPCVLTLASLTKSQIHEKGTCVRITNTPTTSEIRTTFAENLPSPSAAIRGTEPRDDGTPKPRLRRQQAAAHHTPDQSTDPPRPPAACNVRRSKQICGRAREHVRAPAPETTGSGGRL